MIGVAVRHGRTKRDARALAGHLLKDPGAGVEFVNSAAPDLAAAMADMQLARDGSAADAAFLHISLSPGGEMSRDDLRQTADIVMSHFGAAEHQAALVFHDKPRRGGEGGTHAHLVLGRVGPDGEVLPSGFEKIRTETAMRIAEFELGETPVLGRHHASGVKWLRSNGRTDVADWLEAAHGHDPAKPGSGASPEKRQGLARKGVDLSVARDAVRAAWDRSDGPAAFRHALAEQGFDVAAGEKPDVFVVTAGGTEVGALDRLLKERRKAVADRMKGFENVAAVPAAEEINLADRRVEARLQRNPECAIGSREAPAVVVALGRSGEPGRKFVDRAAPGGARDVALGAKTAPSCDGGPSREDRRPRVEEARFRHAMKGFSPSLPARVAMAEIRSRNLAGRRPAFVGRILGHGLFGLRFDRLHRLARETRDVVAEVGLRMRYGTPRPTPVPAAEPADPDRVEQLRQRLREAMRRTTPQWQADELTPDGPTFRM